jgi:hypothetical protein
MSIDRQGISLRYRLAWIALWLGLLGALALYDGGQGGSPHAPCTDHCPPPVQADAQAVAPAIGAAMP